MAFELFLKKMTICLRISLFDVLKIYFWEFQELTIVIQNIIFFLVFFSSSLVWRNVSQKNIDVIHLGNVEPQ